MNIISKDWVVEISNSDELTYVNAWVTSIDEGTFVLAAGLSGALIAVDRAIGAITIAAFNIFGMFVQVPG